MFGCFHQLPRNGTNAREISTLAVLHQALFSCRDKIPYVLGEQMQHKSGWELLQASLLPLASLACESTWQTAEDPTQEFKPQAQGTGHLLGYGNWEALSWFRHHTVDVKWAIVSDLSVRDWGHLLPLSAVSLSLPAVTPQGAAAPPLLCSRLSVTWLSQRIIHPCRWCQQPPSHLPNHCWRGKGEGFHNEYSVWQEMQFNGFLVTAHHNAEFCFWTDCCKVTKTTSSLYVFFIFLLFSSHLLNSGVQ